MPPLDENQFYTVLDGQDARPTYFLKETVTGGGFTATEVPAQEAAPWLIDRALRGEAYNIDAGASKLPAEATAKEIAHIEQAALEVVQRQPGITESQVYETLHRTLGDNPTVIKAGYETYGAEVASKIWGDKSLDTATINDTERVQESKPSDVIQNSQTQGLGPIPRINSSDNKNQNNPGGGAGGGKGQGTGGAGGGAGGGMTGGTGGGTTGADSHGQGTSSTPRSDPKTGGDPLLLASGQLYLQVTDLYVRGRGIHFAFCRTYLHQTQYRGPMGFSWDHCYNLWLREAQEILPDGSSQNVVYRSNGEVREDRFIHVTTSADPPTPIDTIPDATFQGPTGFFDELSKTAGVYRLRMVNGTIITYNEDLRVESIADTSGNALTFFYQDSLLVRVTDAVGRHFDFVNDEMGRVVQLLDRTGGRRLAYAYDDIGNLIETDIFADKDTASSTDYVYIGMDGPYGMEHNLIEVVGADGNSSLLVTYSAEQDGWSYNRVVEQRSEDGVYSYEYGTADFVEDADLADQTNLPRSVTTVTYPNSHIIEHAFNGQGNVVRRREELNGLISGGGALFEELISLYTYNAEGMMIREERPDGATVSYLYEIDLYEELNGPGTAQMADSGTRLNFGNLLRRSETARAGTGETRQLITTWTYLPASSLIQRQRGPYYASPTGIEIPGQATPTVQYTYDALKRLIRIDYEAVATPDGSTQALPSNNFTYNTKGCLTELRIGTLRTVYEYFPDLVRSGLVQRQVEDVDGLARETVYEMDDLGRMVGMRDSLGAETHWEYNGFDLVTRTVLPPKAGLSPEATVVYDRMRRATLVTETVVNADGTLHPDSPLIHSYRYDANGRLIETKSGPAVDPEQRRRRTLYYPWGQPRRMIDEKGIPTDLHYDARNLLNRVKFAVETPVASEQYLRYNRSGELTLMIDSLGKENRTERDGFGRVKRVTDRDGNIWETEYDAQDRAIVRHLRGAAPGATPGTPPITWSECRQEFDAVGRLLRRIDALFVPGDPTIPTREIVTNYFYDEFSRLVEVRDGTVTTHKFTYDGLGRLIKSEDADGNWVRNQYDDAGRKLEVIRAEKELGSVPARFEYFRTQVLYNEQGVAVEETDTVGNTTRRKYDSRNLVVEVTAPDGRTASYQYDLFGSLRTQSLQKGATVITASREYDAAGRLTILTTPRGDKSQWTYDARGRLSESTSVSGSYTYQYDAEGRVIEEHAPSGLRIRTSYSPEGLPLTRKADTVGYLPPAGLPAYLPQAVPPVTFTYTPHGDIRRIEEGANVILMEYDSLGRTLRETSGPTTFDYRWDDAGRQSGFSFPNARQIDYEYSEGGYLTQIKQASEGAAYPGDPAAPSNRLLVEMGRLGARPGTIDAPGLLQANYLYDAARRLVGIDYKQAGAFLERLRVLHGGGGSRLLDDRKTGLRDFTYDPLGRLQQAEDHPSALLSGSPFFPTTLAPAASEVGLGAVVQQPAIDAFAQATAAGGGLVERSFGYVLDAAGNRLSDTSTLAPGGAPETTTYAPAPGDRYGQIDGLATIYDRDGNLLSDGVRTFRYDVLGRLCETIAGAGGMVTSATYDPLGRLAELSSGGNAFQCRWAGHSLVELQRGADRIQMVPGDRINSPAHIAAAGRDLIPIVDDIGSVIAWAGAGGMLGSRQYDPFGRVLTSNGLDPAPLGFAGYLLAPQTELYWLAARVYDAKLGRFLQPDPMGFVDGLNVYAFARNAPGTFIDPLGFKSNELDWGTVALSTAKTVGVGLLIVGGAAAAVSAGIVSAPFVITVGGLLMVGGAMTSFFKRSDEAFAAGKTDATGDAALAALGDPFGVTNIYEGATGRDAVTDRTLGSQERSERLGNGIGTTGTLIFGPKAAKFGGRIGTPSNPMSLYTVPSISRPTYYNPLVTGKYVSPEGIVWEGNVFRGAYRATTRSWRAPTNPGGFANEWQGQFRSNDAGGSYWHVRSHFADMPGRAGAHSYFDPAFRDNMVLLGDAPYIAQRGGTVDIGDFKVAPEQVYPLREVWPNAVGHSGRGYGGDSSYYSMYAFVEDPYPQIGTSGGTPSASQAAGILNNMPPAPPAGTPLNGGYRVILRDTGEPGLVNMATMYPE